MPISDGQNPPTPMDVIKGTLLATVLCGLASLSVVIDGRNWLLGGIYFLVSLAMTSVAFALVYDKSSTDLVWAVMWSVVGAAILDLVIIMLLVFLAANASHPVGENPVSVDWMSPTAIVFVALVCGVGIGMFLTPRRR